MTFWAQWRTCPAFPAAAWHWRPAAYDEWSVRSTVVLAVVSVLCGAVLLATRPR